MNTLNLPKNQNISDDPFKLYKKGLLITKDYVEGI